MNNIDLKEEINLIENKKNKYFIIGLILGFIPYLIILIVCNTLNVSTSFKEILIIMGLITAIFNAYILSNQVFKRLIEFFNLKYDTDYYKIKGNL